MTQLEKDMLEAIEAHQFDGGAKLTVPKAAAEVAKRYIEMAYKKGTRQIYFQKESYQKWLIENGIVEQPKSVISNGLTSTEE